MHDAPRFSMETIDDETDLPNVEVSSLSKECQKAFQNFRYAWFNVFTLDASMRSRSSYTPYAVETLVTLLIAKKRLNGTAASIDIKETLGENAVPEDIQQLLLERLNDAMLHRLALEPQKTVTKESSSALQQNVFERICETFNARN